MLPGGFKKDSRVWLHKNAHVYQKKALTSDGYKVQHNDDVYNHVTEDPYLTPSPYITDEFGKVFKKDSRTWLHKSSIKKLAKTMTTGVIRVASTAGKATKKRQSRAIVNLSGGEMGSDVVRTRSSTEMVRKQKVMLKVKSKIATLTLDGASGTVLDSVKEVNTNVHPRQQGASYHQMKTAEQGNCEVSAYASDFCIVGKKNPTPMITFSSSSDTENDYDKSEVLSHADNAAFTQCEMLTHNLYNGGGFGRTGFDSSNVEIARDGLRELEKMMKEQSGNRSAVRRMDDSLIGLQHDVSPDTVSSGSKVSMDACINLSEELGNDTCQLQNSMEQLSQTFEYMHLRSPKLLTPPGSTRPSGDS